MAAPDDPPREDPQRGLIVPALAGVAASGFFVLAVTQSGLTPLVAPLILFGGAAVIGIVVGNPGNEAALLAGTILPAALLAVIEPHHGCVQAPVGLWIVLGFVAAIGLMFVGLIVGLIWGRGLGIRPLRPPVLFAVLAIADLLAVAGWIALAGRLSAGSIC
jgi:hypothetical protein